MSLLTNGAHFYLIFTANLWLQY